MEEDPFKRYLREKEPEKREKAYAWRTAIGLQDVDGLKVSPYLLSLASRHIEGEVSFDEVSELLHRYYEGKPSSDRTAEADEVSERIARLLSKKAFSFSIAQYLSIHRTLFAGIFPHAGKVRGYDITKKEWILDGASVYYASHNDIMPALEYDFAKEKGFSYAGLSADEAIAHLSSFIAGVWQIHPFEEGNSRTAAVFLIKYLRSLGYEATNDIFAGNAWYFRNALVRANYANLKLDIEATTEYLELFLRNLLLDEKAPLQKRTMHISGAFNNPEKANIEGQKANIGDQKANIESQKANIERLFTPKTRDNVLRLLEEFGYGKAFGRSDVMKALSLHATRSSLLLKAMAEAGIISPVLGQGKGKYRFSRI